MWTLLFDPTSKVLLVLKYHSVVLYFFCRDSSRSVYSFCEPSLSSALTASLSSVCIILHYKLTFGRTGTGEFLPGSGGGRNGSRGSRGRGARGVHLATWRVLLGRLGAPTWVMDVAAQPALCPPPLSQLFFCFSRAPVSSWRSFQQI